MTTLDDIRTYTRIDYESLAKLAAERAGHVHSSLTYRAVDLGDGGAVIVEYCARAESYRPVDADPGAVWVDRMPRMVAYPAGEDDNRLVRLHWWEDTLDPSEADLVAVGSRLVEAARRAPLDEALHQVRLWMSDRRSHEADRDETPLDIWMEQAAELDRRKQLVQERRDAEIRRLIAEGMSVRQLAEMTGTSVQRIYQIRDGRR